MADRPTLAELGQLAKEGYYSRLFPDWEAAAAAIVVRLAQANDNMVWDGVEPWSPSSDELYAIAAEAKEVSDG